MEQYRRLLVPFGAVIDQLPQFDWLSGDKLTCLELRVREKLWRNIYELFSVYSQLLQPILKCILSLTLWQSELKPCSLSFYSVTFDF